MNFGLDWRRHQTDILCGIRAELAKSSGYLDFIVREREPEGRVWKVFVDMRQTVKGGLDESLEGAAAWWAGPPKGGADVLSVDAETEQINLRFATTAPSPPGEKIRIYPPRYLEALLNCWSLDGWAKHCLEWFDRVTTSNSLDGSVPSASPFSSWLRKGQNDSFRLPGWLAGFLWGPPGTGKTTTLGAILAQYLVQFPSSHILLLSTTNSAVDLALVAVDKCLEKLSKQNPASAPVRKRCFRIGNHFIARNYQGREHLLPVKDESLIQKLAQLEAESPDPANVQAYARWKGQVELVRKDIRLQAVGVMQNARLAAMTTTRAAFSFQDLYELPRYDLAVFDEASQVGLAHAMAIAPLGRHAIYAGDPRQLAPIVQSGLTFAKCWLGRSMFYHMDPQADCASFLNEQSRMAEPICRIVSNLFYDGRLVVAGDCSKNGVWTKERRLRKHQKVGADHTSVVRVETDGSWSPKYHGPIRYESAEIITDLVSQLCKDPYNERVLVLTPFRAQRTFIRVFLKKARCKKVLVSTVHRAQGTEQQTVVFDPVDGNSRFLRSEEAERLVNVAISRAKARFIVLLSAGDRRNPLLSRIGEIIEQAKKDRSTERLGEIIEQAKKDRSAERFGWIADSTSAWIINDYLLSITPYAIDIYMGGQKLRGRRGQRAVRMLLGAFMSDLMVHSLRHRTPSEIESIFSLKLPATVKWRRLASPVN